MQLRLSTIQNLAIGGLLIVVGGMAGYRYGTGTFPFSHDAPPAPQFNLINTLQPTDKKDVNFQQFWEVWRMLEQQYVDPEKLNAKEMVDGAIRGMTQGLGDPYTSYLSEDQNKQATEQLKGSFYGVGIQLGYIESTLAVIAPLEDSPAEEAGVKAGDLILHVQDKQKDLDEDTSGWSLDQAVTNIRGPRNSHVILTLYRKDTKEPFEVDLQRDEIVIPSVETEFLDKNGQKVAYIKLSTFNERTEEEWNQAVRDINTQKPIGIILDMRNNPGGLFDTAIEVASDFIPDGVVVSQQGKFNKQDYRSTGSGRLTNYEVEVVVNKGSASASEIVAGALRDRKQAKLIGEKTFGKGTVQDRQILSNGGALHVTVAKWLLPSGEWIHHEGIPVDIEVQDNQETEEDEVVLRALEEL